MSDRKFLFSHEVPAFLGVTPQLFDRLRKDDGLPSASRVPETCIFYYSTLEMMQFREDIRQGGKLHGRYDYLLSMDRES